MSRVHRRQRHKKSQNSTYRRILPKQITTPRPTPNCLICSLASYKPDREDLCEASPDVKAIHDDLMRAGRRALGSAIYRPLEHAYASALAAA
jgi:hypothetical protein